jgi:hypothetical protein
MGDGDGMAGIGGGMSRNDFPINPINREAVEDNPAELNGRKRGELEWNWGGNQDGSGLGVLG